MFLRTHDAKIRKQRRFVGYDGLPRRDKVDDTRDEETQGVGRSTSDITEIDSNDVEVFFDSYSLNEQDYEHDEAQLQFERELANEDQQNGSGGALYGVEDAVDEGIDSWFDKTDENTGAKDSGFEWDDFAFNAEEFDEAPDRADLFEVRTDGRISREQRALQQAAELAEEYGWDERGTELLAMVFNRYFWGSAKGAVRREIERGMTPDELEVALGIRDFWRERTEFSIDLGYWRSGGRGLLDTSRATYRSLSWPAVLRLIRLTNTIPDQVEIEILLDELYLEWYSSNGLQRRYPSFRIYLYRWLDYTEDRSELIGTWSVSSDEGRRAGLFVEDDWEPTRPVHDRAQLARQGALSTGEDDPYIEWMSHAERKIFGEILASRSKLCP